MNPNLDVRESLNNLLQKLQLRFKDGKIQQKTCSICYDAYKKPMMVTCCNNIYCSYCLLVWLSTHRKCPLCRTRLNISMLLYRTDNKEKITKNTKITKKDHMLQILKKYKDEKCIIFVSIKSMVESIMNFLNFHEFSYTFIYGPKAKREKNIRSYREGKVNIIILTDVFKFIGLNLKETKHIINYIGMHNESTCCAVSCVQQMNNKSSVTIHHLI